MPDALVLNRPDGPSAQLMLLLHGEHAGPDAMAWLGARLAAVYPQAWIVALDATVGAAPDDLPAAAVTLHDAVQHWQATSGVSAEGTALIGFSRGADLALEAVRDADDLRVGRLVAIAATYARVPPEVPPPSTLHLIHGKHDPVVPYRACVATAEHLIAIGADLTADVLPFVGHDLDAEVAELLLERLQTYLPRRRWEEALRAAPPEGGSVQ